ncbi:conserved hypothetical protein [delta proteobacterium NaphS2]|nr:conserved hypothetical protein [delta proteobacterium NaphS2]
MKRMFVLTLIVLAIWASPAIAGLTASPGQIEFGNLKEGPPAQKSVILTNTGDAPTKITNVSTSCACTTTKLSRQELAPGQTADLTITYQTYKYAGKFDKTVTVETDDKQAPRTIIHLVGNVAPIPMGVLDMNPRKVDVGNLTLNQPKKIEIPVQNTGDAPLRVNKVSSIKFKKTYYDSGDQGIRIPAGETKSVPVTIVPQKAGRFLDIILIYAKDARNDVGNGYKAVLVGKVQ